MLLYEAEPVDPDAGVLAAWTVDTNEAGAPTAVRGPCPACAHPTSADVTLEGPDRATVLGPLPAVPLTESVTRGLTCACPERHNGPTDTPGCGRSWYATIVPRSDGGFAVVRAENPTVTAAAKRLVEAVRAARQVDAKDVAKNWLAGVTALYGLFGIAGVAVGKDTISALDLPYKIAAGALVGVGVLIAASATILAYRAAFGWPSRSVPLRNDEELLSWAGRFEDHTFSRLRAAVACAGVAIVLLVATTGLIWFGPPAESTVPGVTVAQTDDTRTCGELLDSRGDDVLRVRDADGAVHSIPLDTVTKVTVDDC